MDFKQIMILIMQMCQSVIYYLNLRVYIIAMKQQQKQQKKQSKTSEQPYIGGIVHAPCFLKDNQHIKQGYRVNFTNMWSLVKSLFMVHNESVNIWSHLIGAIVLLLILISFLVVTDKIHIGAHIDQYKQQLTNSIQNWHQSLANITFIQDISNYREEMQQEFQLIKSNVMQTYSKTLAEIHQKTVQINEFLNDNMNNIKQSIKQDLKHRLQDIQQFKQKYQSVIAPAMIASIQEKFNSQLANSLIHHFQDIKNILDSEIFDAVELNPKSPNIQHISRWPIFIFLATAAFCLWCSTIFHIFHPMNKKTYTFLQRFDFAGISLLIAGSSFPVFYYGMYCQMAVAVIYLSLTCLAAVAVFIIGFFEWIHMPGNHRYRSFLFGSFGLSMIVPLTHMVVNQFVYDNYGDPFRFSDSIAYYILLAASYLGGLYIFTIRCPERNNPGKFDICGHSHQIWHFFVILGIFFTYQGSITIYESRKNCICPA